MGSGNGGGGNPEGCLEAEAWDLYQDSLAQGIQLYAHQMDWIFESTENYQFAMEALDALQNGGEVDFDEKIINNLEGKADCIYQKLKAQNVVRQILDKFQNEESPARLKLKLASLGNVFAETTPPDSNDLITIKLNSDNGFWGVDYQPNLLVAQTIFHEIIHAEFARQLVVAIGAGNYSGATVSEIIIALSNSNYPTLYEYYRTYRDWSHNFMADYFRDTIARATQEFATGIAVPDNVNPDQLYLDLAWRGLRIEGDVVAWDQLTEQQQTTINQVINTYTNSNANQICTE